MDESNGAADSVNQPGMSVPAPAFEIAVEYANRVNFAMQQDGVPLVERVSITNAGPNAVEGLTLTISLDNGECDPWTRAIDRIEPGAISRVDPDGLTLNAQRLAQRTEAERTSLRVQARVGDHVIEKVLPVELLAFDQWPGAALYPELLAAFATPNHSKIAELLAAARESLRSASGNDSLDGYQSGSRRRATQIAEACFHAAAAAGIGYINPPASFGSEGQRVRLVDRICREKLASCLDLSLLLASMWEQAGLHAMVLLIEGHAMPAVWTHESHLPEPAIDEAARIRNLIELGEVVPVEATLVTKAGAGFASAVEAAKRSLASPGSEFCAVDIRASRKRGVRPLPLRVEGDHSEVDIGAMRDPARPAAAATTVDRVALADRAETAASATAREEKPVETGSERIKRWQMRLLDLSLRNRLINFRSSGRTIQLMAPDVAMVENRLAAEGHFFLQPRTDGDDAYLREQAEAGHLYTSETAAETQKRLLGLYRLAKASIEETGANLLHLAIGMLKWYETEESETARYAPLILLPVQLSRSATGAGYKYELSLSEEPLRPNVTLLEKLRTEFGMNTAGLDEMPEDENGLDVPLILRNFRAAIRDAARWEVEETCHLGLFSFNKFLMWRDLQDNLDRLRRNRLVTHLIDGGTQPFEQAPFPSADELDEQVGPGELCCTRDADSTQLAAVRAAAEGRTFVLEGPPGTGKSQTIANIIADSLAKGKRVLFVAEKMAALSVVRRRLEEDGLGPFCLELHSAKASKKEVLAQLEHAVNAEVGGIPPNWDALCAELGATRDSLNTYVRELHAARASGESLYRVLGRLTILGDGPRVGVDTGKDASGQPVPLPDVSAAQLAGWRQHVARLIEMSAAVDPVHKHPLRGIGRTEWSFTLPDEARASIAKAKAARDAFRESAAAVMKAVGAEDQLADELSRDTLTSSLALIELLPSSPAPNIALLVGNDAASIIADFRRLCDEGVERDEKRRELLTRYQQEFLSLPHLAKIDELRQADRSAIPLITRFFARRKFRAYCIGATPSIVQLITDLETAREVKRLSDKLAAATEAAQVLGRRWNGGEANWADIRKLLDWCERFIQAAAALRRDAMAAPLVQAVAEASASTASIEAAGPGVKAVGEARRAWREAWTSLATLLAIENEGVIVRGTAPRWFHAIGEVFARWNGALASLNDWCAWRKARNGAVGGGLADLVARHESGELGRAQIGDAFERGFGEAWFNAVANTVASVREFNAGAHGKLIDRFRQVDQSIIEQTRHVVASRLRSNAPVNTGAASGQSEMGILNRELQKKRRHIPTRRLIELMPNLLARLKPCFLMSPLSVAQYLDAGLPAFDMVVFDEASQIPVWDSIGAIARGAAVIVVGDSKQLPPTSFFETMDGEDEVEHEDTVVDDMESILKECNASGLPPMHLSWHYRSRHESLIAFSNHHYYENRLHTFPSPEDRSESLGVRLRLVEKGVYDRGNTRTNPIEAATVVDEVVRLLLESPSPDSIGVVTFNQAQQELIENLLDARRRENPAIDRFFTNEVHEPVFVKNLENVQGDERDTIIFSVAYGPDSSGRPSMNFGPLNKDGGERRLNVAVTRARRRLVVFSSLRSDQIDLKRTRSLGVKHFKTFLDYADRGPAVLADAVKAAAERAPEDGFESAVRQALIDRGHRVDARVGCAGYRIDLGVRDPRNPDRYMLGIECDGPSYHSAKTARDRDRLRQSVLRGLGWRIERIWCTEWRINPERCIATIEKAIAEAAEHRLEPEAVRMVPPSPSPPSSSRLYARGPAAAARPAPSALPLHPPYVMASPSRKKLDQFDIFDRAAGRDAVAAIGRIVKAEAPIVEELVMRRLAAWFGVQRMTDRYRERFGELLASAVSTGEVRSGSGALWPADANPAEYAVFRVQNPDSPEDRELELIPLVERVNAVVHVVREQFGLPREELEREAVRLLGGRRATARAREAVAEAIDVAIERGRLEVRDGRVTLGSIK